jgi:hypothetical protein
MSYSTFLKSDLYGGCWSNGSQGTFQDSEIATGGNFTQRERMRICRGLVHREVING